MENFIRKIVEGAIDDMVFRDEPKEKHVKRMSKDLGPLIGFPIEKFKNKEIKNIADKNFFSQLVKTTQGKDKEIIKEIVNLVTEKKFNKMESLIKVILKLGFCEILYFNDIPSKVSIAEYNKVADSFLNKKEVGLINNILDKISKNNNG